MSALKLSETITQLLRFGDSPSSVFSLFLDCTTGADGHRSHLPRLRQLAREAEPLDTRSAEHSVWNEGVQQARQFLELDLSTGTRGAALFFCQDPELRITLELPVSIGDRLALSHSPQLDPLLELQSSNVSYCVLVVHHLNAQLYRYEDMDLALAEEWQESVASSDERDWEHSSAHLQDHSRRFLSRVAQVSSRALDETGIGALVLLGTDANRGELRRGLPPVHSQRIVLEQGIPPHRDQAALEHEILTILQRIDRPVKWVDPEVLRHLEERLGQQHRVTSGVSAILFHLQAGNVEHLFLSSDFHSQGCRCVKCGFVFGKVRVACRYCGGDVDSVQLRNRLEKLAQGHHVPFDFVESPSFLDPLGGTAGFLREPGLRPPR